MTKTFKYIGSSGALIFRGETLKKDKPFTTDNALLISALEARASNVGDIKEVEAKPVEKKEVKPPESEKAAKAPKKKDD